MTKQKIDPTKINLEMIGGPYDGAVFHEDRVPAWYFIAEPSPISFGPPETPTLSKHRYEFYRTREIAPAGVHAQYRFVDSEPL